jgi:hypothetical protein
MSYEELCVFGHERHEHILSHDWVLYDWRLYMDLPEGWCPGRCDISRTIDLYGYWEKEETARFWDCLTDTPNRGEVVIDVGANVGWYTMQAAAAGFHVHAIEGITETLELLMENADRFQVVERVVPHRAHWDATTELSWDLADLPVRIVKIDIEGNEPDAVRVLAPFFEHRMVQYAMIEVSPAFGPHYQPMVQAMFDYGYRADIDGVPLLTSKVDVPQANVWFERRA